MSRRPQGHQQSTSAVAKTDVVVIGAGFGGLYALHHLREAGFSVLGLESGPEVGGTWFWNRYPGARCDVPSPFYSYSWDPELRAEWEWSEVHATQPEILSYLNHVADKYNLRDLIQFEARLARARFDEDSSEWELVTDTGRVLRTRYCVMASGNLSVPHVPPIDGLKDFGGPIIHTAAWPDESFDVRGMRVGVIGTGSSGVQVIPILAESADQLWVFQRTPNFCIPARNRPLSESERTQLEALIPQHHAAIEAGRVNQAAREAPVPPREEQWRHYEELWAAGGGGLLAAYPNIFTSQELNDSISDFVRDKIRGLVEDPEVAESLCPTDYPFGVKRACLESGYYDAFNRDHVLLVNLRKEPFVQFDEGGVHTSARYVPLDALVVATGFDAFTGALSAIDIRGRRGLPLREAWRAGPRAYLGLSISGFPNLFTLTGPGSPSVFGNVVFNLEHHVELLTDLLLHAAKHDVTEIEADAAAEEDWLDGVGDVAAKSLFLKANSWYLGANIAGKKRVFMPYVGPGYRAKCEQVARDGYQGFHLK